MIQEESDDVSEDEKEIGLVTVGRVNDWDTNRLRDDDAVRLVKLMTQLKFTEFSDVLKCAFCNEEKN